MLNELFELHESMEKAGIQPPSLNRHYKEVPKRQPAFFLELDANGNAVGLRKVSDEDCAKLRKWEETPTQGISFPTFNVPSLLQVSEQGYDNFINLKKAIQAGQIRSELSKAIQSLWDTNQGGWNNLIVERITKSLKLSNKLADCLGNVPQDYFAMQELIKRAGKADGARLAELVRDLIVSNLDRAQDESRIWLDLLANTGKGSRNFSLVLELDNSFDYKYPVHSPLVQDWVNECLQKHDMKSRDTESTLKDAFGWPYHAMDSDETFPEVRLPVVGNTKLRAMFSAQRCQFRYGRADAYSFPAGKDLRQAMKNSLEWLVKDELKGKTWQSVTGACGFKNTNGKKIPIPALLLVYPNTLPAQLPDLATFMGGGGGDNSEQFATYAARVTEALKIKVPEYRETMINILVIKQVDKARRKIVVNRNCSAISLIEAATEWRQGCANIPELKFKLGTIWITPEMPFPVGVTRLLNKTWLRSGIEYQESYGLSIGEGIALLLDNGWQGQRLAEKTLRLTITGTTPLLLGLGHADHRREEDFKLSWEAAHDGSMVLSLLGLLLFKLNKDKGGYMHSAPFLVGNMMALADILHREYCKQVRDGSIPPQLIGNALMPVALSSPEKGIARLSERILIYKAWADKVSGDESRLAKWTLSQMRRVSDELAVLILPDSTKDSEKAQMLLGYLGKISQDSPVDDKVENQKGEN